MDNNLNDGGLPKKEQQQSTFARIMNTPVAQPDKLNAALVIFSRDMTPEMVKKETELLDHVVSIDYFTVNT